MDTQSKAKTNTTISKEEEQIMRRIPLSEVMQKNGFKAVRSSDDNLYYHCPNPAHRDTNASFSVSRHPVLNPSTGDNTLGAFHCHGCGVSGYGAISLQQLLMGHDSLKGDAYTAVLRKLATDHGIKTATSDTAYGFEFAKVPAVNRITWDECPWTDTHLEALGCKVTDVFVQHDEKADEINTGRKTYSWGRDYYNPYSTERADNLNMSDISATFGIYPVSSYTVPAKQGNKNSTQIRFKESMPGFIIRMRDSLGNERIRTYCPMNMSGHKWGNYSYNKLADHHTFKSSLNGDADIIKSLYSNAEPRDTSGTHPVCNVMKKKGDGYIEERRFSRVVICSGPRDAMQVYYHSDSHVVYPQSESLQINPQILKRLKEIASDVYILFDADEPGQRAARNLNLSNMTMHNVELPSDLKEIRSRRTGRPCKDVSEYFEQYESHLSGMSINAGFDSLLNQSPALKFYTVKPRGNKTDRDAGIVSYSYDLISENIARFLSYSGMCRVVDGKSKRDDDTVYRVCYKQGRVVDFLGREDRKSMARQLIKSWAVKSRLTDPVFMDTVINSRKFNDDLFSLLPVEDLDFTYWSSDYQYFFFENVAVRVTAESITSVAYDALDFYVNRQLILPYKWSDCYPSPFTIDSNSNMETLEREHRQRLMEIETDDKSSLEAEQNRWERMMELYQYRLRLNLPMNEASWYMQYVYDTSRIYWREEETSKNQGKPVEEWLTPIQHQTQDAHFISKAAALGYLLSRYRSSAMPYTVVAMDYKSDDFSLSNGRTGKSLFPYCLGLLTQVIHKAGKQIYTTADTFNRNFREVDPQFTGVVDLSDPEVGFDVETLNNISEGIMSIKMLHHDEISIPEDKAPKVYISYNRDFDSSSKSVRARLWELSFSDYYYPDGTDGRSERSPKTKFHGADFKNIPEEERYKTIAFLFSCLQFHFSTMKRIYAPQDSQTEKRKMYALIKDLSFIKWANRLFQNEQVFGYPVAINDMVASWFSYKRWRTDKSTIRGEGRDEFLRMLKIYCAKSGIVLNPSVVFANTTDEQKGIPRTATYTYDIEANGNFNMSSRSRKKDLSVFYFYRLGSEPTDRDLVVRNPKDDIGFDI